MIVQFIEVGALLEARFALEELLRVRPIFLLSVSENLCDFLLNSSRLKADPVVFLQLLKATNANRGLT